MKNQTNEFCMDSQLTVTTVLLTASLNVAVMTVTVFGNRLSLKTLIRFVSYGP